MNAAESTSFFGDNYLNTTASTGPPHERGGKWIESGSESSRQRVMLQRGRRMNAAERPRRSPSPTQTMTLQRGRRMNAAESAIKRAMTAAGACFNGAAA